MSKVHRTTERMCGVFGLVVGLFVCAGICAKPSAAEWKEKPANTPIPRYFDKSLRSIQDRLIKLEWDYLQTKPKVENCPPPTIERYLTTLPPRDLSRIAIWSNLALRDNPPWHRSLHNSVYYGAIWELGQRKGPEAEKAIIDVAYQSTIDTHPGEALVEAWERCTHREFRFGKGVHPRFLDESLESPMSEEAANFVMTSRIVLISQRQRRQLPPFRSGRCYANFDIVPGGKVSNIKCKTDQKTYSDQILTARDSKTIISDTEQYLKSLQFPSTLPCKLKKVHMSVQFY